VSDITADTRELDALTGSLIATGAKAGARAYAVTRTYGILLQARVKARARAPRSGPPGPEPRLQTGDYNRSITLQMSMNGPNPIAEVGTNKPQGRRLELGFVGQDALGRTYSDPPRPHFGPALDSIAGEFETAIAYIAIEDLS
jgi:hypothetical protein